jgi:hypothetical protein
MSAKAYRDGSVHLYARLDERPAQTRNILQCVGLHVGRFDNVPSFVKFDR